MVQVLETSLIKQQIIRLFFRNAVVSSLVYLALNLELFHVQTYRMDLITELHYPQVAKQGH